MELTCRKQLSRQFHLRNSANVCSKVTESDLLGYCFIDSVEVGLRVAKLENIGSCSNLEDSLCELV